MLRRGDLLNQRWEVLGPFAWGNCANFTFFMVRDDWLEDRVALLKTVRKTDLPAPELYAWRRRALEAEVERTGLLTSPWLPEPLDRFEHDGEPVLVSSLVSHAPGNWPLLDKLKRWGFLDEERGSLHRQIDLIARYLHDLLHFTEDLWEEGFVHANLAPDHLIYFRDGILRVTGGSALCRVVDGRIDPDEPGLRNLAPGYQSQRHRAVAEGRSAEPLNAAQVRWHTYAAAALDLIWGRDFREFCLETGDPSPSLERNGEVEQRLWQEFRQFMINTFSAGREPALQKPLRRMFELLRACLNPSAAPLPASLFKDFQDVWQDLDRSDFNFHLQVPPEELNWREERGWTKGSYSRLDYLPPWRFGERSDFLVLGEEYRHEQVRNGSPPQVFARYEVVSLKHPPKRRSEMQSFRLQTLPFFDKFFLPGDIIPGEFAGRDLESGLPLVFLNDWADERKIASRPQAGQALRALSLGRRYHPTAEIGYPVPMALVEHEGAIKALQILPAHDGQTYTVFPRRGEFFQAEYVEQGSRRWVVPMQHPPIETVVGLSQLVTVDAVVKPLVFFDIPLGDDFFVSGVIPEPRFHFTVLQGMQVKVKVREIRDGHLIVDEDSKLASDQASVGVSYSGRFVRHEDDFTNAAIDFGEFGYIGLLRHDDRKTPWGLPSFAWQEGQSLLVKVRAAQKRRDGSYRYELQYEGEPPPLRVENVFVAGSRLTGRVLAHEGEGVRVLLTYGDPAAVQATGLLPFRKMLRSDKQNYRTVFAIGTDVDVLVEEVDPDRRRILLTPIY
jgi:hypothetical protein